MRLLGYSDRLSAAPGDTIRFMVSCEHPSYRAALVRLIHGDETPRGPGYKERLVASDINGEYPGRVQHIHSGSYVIVEDSAPLRQIESFHAGRLGLPHHAPGRQPRLADTVVGR